MSQRAATHPKGPTVQATGTIPPRHVSPIASLEKAQEPVRAVLTHRLVSAWAPELGLDAGLPRIRCDEEARRFLQARAALGWMENDTVWLHPSHYNPQREAGRFLLGHELVHAAQRSRTRRRYHFRAPDSRVAEREADILAAWLARTGKSARPAILLPPDAAPAKGEAVATPSLEDLVATNYKKELEDIRGWLETGFFDWAVTDADIENILRVLEGLPFMTAVALIEALRPPQRSKISEELSNGHFTRFRRQVLACYLAMINKSDLSFLLKNPFRGMSFANLDPEEHYAARLILKALGDKWKPSESDKPLIETILVTESPFDAAQASKNAMRDEAQTASERKKSEQLLKQQDVQAVLQRIRNLLKKSPIFNNLFVTDNSVREVLDLMHTLLSDPEKFRAIAQAMEGEGLTDTLIDNLPVGDLQNEIARSKSGALVDRRKVFLRLIAERPPYKNVKLAEDLLSYGFLDWAITDDEAFLAFQLIKVLPQRSRDALYRAEGGLYGTRLREELSQSQREGKSMNFYAGGARGRDLSSIQTQLLEDTLWIGENRVRLDGLIRMAIAAGEHRWVFDQSKQRFQKQPAFAALYEDPAFLRDIIEKHLLYREPKRKEFNEQVSETLEGKPFGTDNFLYLYIIQGIDFIATTDKITTSPFGAKGFDLSELQDVLGGDIGGVRFKRLSESSFSKEALRNNYVLYDSDTKKVEAKMAVVDIAAVSSMSESLKTQAAGGVLSDVSVEAYNLRKSDKEPVEAHASIASIELNDVLLVFADSMIAIKKVQVRGLRVNLNTGDYDFKELAVPGKAAALAKRFGVNLLFDDARNLEFSAEAVILDGLTTSGGQFVSKLRVEDLDVRVAETRDDYKKSLLLGVAYYRRLEESAKKPPHPAPEERLHRLQRKVHQLHTELGQFQRAEADVARYTAQEKKAPLGEEEQKRLAEAQALLKRFDQGGLSLDFSTAHLSGLQGNIEASRANLGNVHLRANRTAALLAMFLPENLQVQNLLLRPGARPEALAYLPAAANAEEGGLDVAFEIEHFDAANVRVAGGIPTSEELRSALEKADEKLAAAPRNTKWIEKRQELADRLAKVEAYEALAARGVAALTPLEQQKLLRLRHDLLEATSFAAESARGELVSGEVGPLTTKVRGLNAVSRARLTARLLELTNVKAPSFGLEAQRVSAENFDLRLVSRDGEQGAEIRAGLFQVSGIHIRQTRAILDTEKRVLLARPHPSPKDTARLKEVEGLLEELDSWDELIAQQRANLEAAKGKTEATQAAENLGVAQTAFEHWRRKLALGELTVRDVAMGVSGLGNVFAEDWEFAQVMRGPSTIRGLGPEGRLWSSLEARDSRIPGLEADLLKTGTVSGEIEKTENAISVRKFRIESLEAARLSFYSPGFDIWTPEKSVLKGLVLDATIQFKPDEKDPENKTFDNIIVNELRVDEGDIRRVNVFIAAQEADPTKGLEKSEELRIELPYAKVLGLVVKDFDLRALKGTIDLASYDLQGLSLRVGEVFKESMAANLSARGMGMGGTLIGPDFTVIDFGHVASLKGSYRDAEIETSWDVNRITGGVTIGRDARGNRFIQLASIDIGSVALGKTRFNNGKEMVVNATSVQTGPISVGVVRVLFQKVKEKGKDKMKFSHLQIDDLVVHDVVAGAFSYHGQYLGPNKKGEEVWSQTSFEAQGARAKSITLSLLDHDVTAKRTVIGAHAEGIGLDKMAVTLKDTATKTLKSTTTELFGDLTAQRIFADLTFEKTKLVNGKDWTRRSGWFHLTGAGIIDPKVIYTGEGGEKLTVESIGPHMRGRVDLNELDATLGANGTLLVDLNTLTAQNLKLTVGSTKVILPWMQIKGAVIGLKNLGLESGLQLLGAKLDRVSFRGLDVSMEIERVAATKEEVAAWKKPDRLRIEPLGGLSGTFFAGYERPDSFYFHLLFGALPFQDGWVDMESVRAFAVSKNYPKPGEYGSGELFLGWLSSHTASDLANAIGVGVNHEGIYADLPGWDAYVFDRHDLENKLELPGKFPRFPGAAPHRGDEGSIDVRDAAETILNAVRAEPPVEGKAPAAIDILNQIRMGTDKKGVQLGGGVVGTEDERGSPKNFIELAPKGKGKNRLVFSDKEPIGKALDISSPEILATRGGFQAEMEDETGKPKLMKGSTGQIQLLNLRFHIKGLATLKLTVSVYVEQGSIQDVRFGDISVLTEERMAGHPGPELKEGP